MEENRTMMPQQEQTLETDRDAKAEELESTFSYDGYQVVRKELFAHLRDPAIVIRKDSITFNTACITGLEDVVYVHVMFNSDLKRIVVRGCDENDKDALRWCIAKPDKRKSRKMSCKPFSELVYKKMGWDSECRYKMLGYRISFEGETLYVFDLLVPEIFHEPQKRKKEVLKKLLASGVSADEILEKRKSIHSRTVYSACFCGKSMLVMFVDKIRIANPQVKLHYQVKKKG